MDLEIRFKIHTNVSSFDKRPPKPYKLLKFFISFATTVKSCHAPSVWKKMRWKSPCLLLLKSITEIIKYFKSLYDFWGRCLKIKDVCMDFEPYFKVHNLVSVYPKSVILGQMTNLNMVLHMVVSVYRLVKILKLAPVPWWISEQLIFDQSQCVSYTLTYVTAALQSVFPQTELGTFMSLTKRDKERQLNELTLIVTGIRLFNRECGKGGEGIDDCKF